MKLHGNANDNDALHHLYELRDRVDDSVLKYGISTDRVDEDGTSKRMRVQLRFFNLGAGWLRYFGRVLISNIPGRRVAKAIEEELVESYTETTGSRPRGNS